MSATETIRAVREDPAVRHTLRELSVYTAVGLACFLLYSVLYLTTRPFLDPMLANTTAFLLSAWTNTIWHRRYTFQTGKGGSGTRQQVENFATLLLGLLITNGALLGLATAAPEASMTLEYTVLVAANLTAGILHYILLRIWVFKPGRS